MTIHIRKLELADMDLEAYVAMNNRIYTDEVSSVASERHWLSNAPEAAHWKHWVAMQNGTMVGSASHAKELSRARPGSYRIQVAVDPDARRQGIGARLYDHCVSQLNQHHDDVHFLFSFTREHYEDSVHFLEKRGYRLKLREPLSQLQLADFDPVPFLPKADLVRAQGFDIKTLAKLQREYPDWAQRYYELDMEIMADVPAGDPFVPPPFEQFAKQHLEHPEFDPSTYWIAVKDDAWLGVTSLDITSDDSEKAHTGLTGVLRLARRKGVATALKLRAIAHAQERGVKVVQTDNEENNPMFQINLALGFQAIPASLLYRKDCQPHSGQ